MRFLKTETDNKLSDPVSPKKNWSRFPEYEIWKILIAIVIWYDMVNHLTNCESRINLVSKTANYKETSTNFKILIIPQDWLKWYTLIAHPWLAVDLKVLYLFRVPRIRGKKKHTALRDAKRSTLVLNAI